jgi:hypothetical protein
LSFVSLSSSVHILDMKFISAAALLAFAASVASAADAGILFNSPLTGVSVFREALAYSVHHLPLNTNRFLAVISM